MKGDFHVRFRENAGVKLPCVTRLCVMPLSRPVQEKIAKFAAWD